MNDCTAARELARRTLDEGHACPPARLRAHLASCPRCADEWEALLAAEQAMRRAARETAPDAAPPPHMHERIMQAVRAEAGLRPRRARAARPCAWLVPAAAALILDVHRIRVEIV